MNCYNSRIIRKVKWIKGITTCGGIQAEHQLFDLLLYLFPIYLYLKVYQTVNKNEAVQFISFSLIREK